MKNISKMQWDCNTDFQKVFDLILERALEHKLTDDDMIKRIIVFSDMEFDECIDCRSDYDFTTDHDLIKQKFKDHGYTVPQIIYWNLRSSGSKPVEMDERGVAMVSGFSQSLLELFLDSGGNCSNADATSYDWMLKALDKPKYAKLCVVD